MVVAVAILIVMIVCLVVYCCSGFCCFGYFIFVVVGFSFPRVFYPFGHALIPFSFYVKCGEVIGILMDREIDGWIDEWADGRISAWECGYRGWEMVGEGRW